MKKILLLFFLLIASLHADIAKDAAKEAQKEAIKEAITQTGFVPKEEPLGDFGTTLVQNLTVSSTCENYNDLQCPAAADASKYFVRRHGADLKSGKVNCLVYGYENIDRAVANYTYTNPNCRPRWTPKPEDANVSASVQSVVDQVSTEQTLLTQAQTAASTRNEGLTEQTLSLSDLLVAVMTLDGERIDLALSVSQGKIKTASGYTALTENSAGASGNAKLSDAAVEALNGQVVAIFELFGKIGEHLNLAIFILITFFIIAYFIKSGVIIRIWNKNEVESEKSNAIVWVGTLLAGIMLLLVPVISVNIGENMSIQQSNFHRGLQFAFQEASKIAQKINLAVTDATFSAVLKERGFKSTQSIYYAAAENEKLEGIAAASLAQLNACRAIYSEVKLRSYMDATSKFVFPLSEEELHKKLLISTHAESMGDSPYMSFLHTPSAANAVNSSFTLSQCGQAERTYAEAQVRLNQNLQFITQGNTSQDAERREYVRSVIERHYKTITDWGFISAAYLPVVLAEIEIEKIFMSPAATQAKAEDDITDDIIYNLPYLTLPGTGTIVNFGASIGGSVVSNPILDKIPLVKSIAQGLGGLVGAAIAVQFAQVALHFAPLLLLAIIAMIIAIVLLFQIMAYFIAGFFAVLLALWSNNNENIFNFFGRGLRLFGKIIAFPASVFFALQAHWTMSSIGAYITHNYANNVNENILNSFAYKVFGGFLEIALTLASIFLTFKIVSTFVELILENLNFKNQDSLDSAVEQISQQTTRQIKA